MFTDPLVRAVNIQYAMFFSSIVFNKSLYPKRKNLESHSFVLHSVVAVARQPYFSQWCSVISVYSLNRTGINIPVVCRETDCGLYVVFCPIPVSFNDAD